MSEWLREASARIKAAFVFPEIGIVIVPLPNYYLSRQNVARSGDLSRVILHHERQKSAGFSVKYMKVST